MNVIEPKYTKKEIIEKLKETNETCSKSLKRTNKLFTFVILNLVVSLVIVVFYGLLFKLKFLREEKLYFLLGGVLIFSAVLLFWFTFNAYVKSANKLKKLESNKELLNSYLKLLHFSNMLKQGYKRCVIRDEDLIVVNYEGDFVKEYLLKGGSLCCSSYNTINLGLLFDDEVNCLFEKERKERQ